MPDLKTALLNKSSNSRSVTQQQQQQQAAAQQQQQAAAAAAAAAALAAAAAASSSSSKQQQQQQQQQHVIIALTLATRARDKYPNIGTRIRTSPTHQCSCTLAFYDDEKMKARGGEREGAWTSSEADREQNDCCCAAMKLLRIFVGPARESNVKLFTCSLQNPTTLHFKKKLKLFKL
jgi:hypothetical protein